MNDLLNPIQTQVSTDSAADIREATRQLREALALTQAAIQQVEILLEGAPDVSLLKDTSLEPAPEAPPDARPPKRYYIHDGEKPRLCRGCGATIFWATTPRDKKMPVNPDGTSHWETCAERGLFRAEDF